MGKETSIAWTDKTYNPWIGCQHVTEEECGDCFAHRWAKRHRLDVWGPLNSSSRRITKTFRDPILWNKEAEREGRRYKVFCASLADVFEPHPDVVEARARLWDIVEQTPHLDWQLLTKRPKFIRRLVPHNWLQHWPYHVWIGTSVGIQRVVDLVERVTLVPWLVSGNISWIICGGYSGFRDWPMDDEWARALKAECDEWGVSFFMKQMGTGYAKQHGLRHWKGEDPAEFPEDLRVQTFPI